MAGIDKSKLTEADIISKFILPAVKNQLISSCTLSLDCF